MDLDFQQSAQSVINGKENSFFWDFIKVVAKHFVKNFRNILPFAVVLVLLIYFSNLMFSDLFRLNAFARFISIYLATVGMFFIQSNQAGLKPDWPLWLVSSLPYTIMPVIFIQFLSGIGLVFAIMSLVSFAFFVQEIVAKKCNIFNAYCNSFILTWKYNLRLFLTLFMPFMFLISVKIYLSLLIGINYYGWIDLVYIISGIIFLPWFVTVYNIFYEYLSIEKKNV